MNLKMLKMVVVSVALSVSGFANANLVLLADLSVENTITLTATSGTSLATVDGPAITGFYLADFFALDLSLSETLISGDLTSANNTSNNIPNLFNSSDTGLNVWQFSSDGEMSFTAGLLAFSGQASWTVGAATYANALNGAQAGNVYAPADDIGDLTTASLIGTWEVIDAADVPEPSTLAILGLGLMGLASRKFKKQS